MKIHNRLDEILSRGSKIKVLRYLFREDDEHTGLGIAKTVGINLQGSLGWAEAGFSR